MLSDIYYSPRLNRKVDSYAKYVNIANLLKNSIVLIVWSTPSIFQGFPSLRNSQEAEDDDDDHDVLTPQEAEEERLIARDLVVHLIRVFKHKVSKVGFFVLL